MKAEAVDPRDIGRETNADVYRVYFHDSNGASDEWRISEVESVSDVITWATQNAEDRTYVLYVEVPLPGENRMLVQLAGRDPNVWSLNNIELATRRSGA